MAKQWTASQEDAMNQRDRMLVVSAAAGSGKTSVLTERIIRMLTDRTHPADLSRMLIVTFTRAAAAELKERIALALNEALAADPENAHLSHQILSLGNAHISTIDAFFGEEVRTGFAQLGLPPAFRIADEAELNELALPLMEEALSACYETYTTENSTDPNAPFARLRGNRFADVMNHLLKNRHNDDLPAQLWSFYRRFANYPEGIGLLQTFARDIEQVETTDFFSTTAGNTIHRKVSAFCADNLRILDGILSEFEPIEQFPKYEGLIRSDIDFCRTLFAACDNGSYDAARAIVWNYAQGRLPAYKGEKPTALETYKDLRDELKAQVKTMQKDLFAWSEPEIRRQAALTAEECNLLFQLFSAFSSRLEQEKTTRCILSFDDMPALLLRLLEQADGTPTPYAKALAARFDSVFIDEYQDVNPIQDRLFSDIGGDRRFMVGDIKQSIYGFRGGEPSIFADYRKRLPLYDRDRDPGGGVCIFMSENFRCSRPVIEYANRVCAFLFSACEESVGYRPQDDLVCGKSSPEERLQPVRTLLFEPYEKEVKQAAEERGETLPKREPLWVAAEIARLLREEQTESGEPIKPCDIAILIRNSTHMQEYADALAAWGIQTVSPTANDLLASPLLIDTLNLLRAIDNPYRDLPLSEFLLTALGGFSLEELGEIRAAVPMQRALYDAICAAAESPDHPHREKCAAFTAWLERYRKLAAVQPADRFLRLLFADPRLEPHAATPELRTLYDQARTYQARSWCGLYGFLAHFTKLCESGKGLPEPEQKQGRNAVTLMTIHKSKGLEFPVVFLVGGGTPFSRKSATAPILFHRATGLASELFNPQNGENENSILRSAVKIAIEEEEREEEIRTLYVALTRARERLYVSGSIAQGKAEGLFRKAHLIRRGARTQILGASTRMHWIAAAAENGDRHAPFGIRIVSSNEELPSPSKQNAPAPEGEPPKENEPERWNRPTMAEVDRLLALQNVPTKAAASALSPDYLDRLSDDTSPDTIRTLSEAIGVLRTESTDFDALLRDRKQAAPTEIGTALHTFLEVCDFSLLYRNGTSAEIDRLMAIGLLSDATSELLNRRHIDLFRESDLMRDILAAKEVFREQRFGFNLPIRALTRHPKRFYGAENETVFVQGSIDLLLEMPNGTLHLYDYKTDRITDEERADPKTLSADLSLRHGNQLACYARAVRDLFGQFPNRICIYSVPCGEAIPLQIDPHRFDL